MKFINVARCFELLETTDSRIEITQQLAFLFKEATPQEASEIAYLCLGELQPPYKTSNVGMAEKMAIKLIARVLDISEADAQKAAQAAGDVSLVIPHDGWNAKKQYSVSEVYNILLEITDVVGSGSQETKLTTLTQLLQNIDSLSARYIVRIITGKLRLGFSDMTLLDALSWMLSDSKKLKNEIEQGYMVCADIGLIAYKAASGGIQAIKKLDIEVGIPLRPAAAERLPDAEAIIEKIDKPCAVQPKLDGFRLQIHIEQKKNKREIHFFSRNLTNMSEQFPDLHDELSHMPVDSAIFEGEAITYDPETGGFLPFQETAKRKRKYNIEETAAEFPLQLFVFDLLYLNGESMLEKSHKERRSILTKLFKSWKTSRIFLIEETICSTAEQLQTFFLEVVSRGLEGVVVKKQDAPYLPGRRNFNWIKLKRRAQGRLEDTIDAVILGYYTGKGKRAAFGIGSILVGIYNKKTDLFETIARVGTGVSDDAWKELKKRLDAVARKTKPTNINCAPELEPDVWTTPEIVCVIKAEEITLSPLHRAAATSKKLGYALRFPRFGGYVDDKTAEQATESHEIERLYHDQFK